MTRMIVITGFIVAFLAGAMSGFVFKSGAAAPGDEPEDRPGPPPRESWIADQLSLTAEQQAQMKEIWSALGRGGGREMWDKRNQIRRDRDQAIANLIRPEDKAAYDQIVAESKQKQDALEAEGRKAFLDAVEKTKAILTPEQREKYKELLAHGPGHGRDGRDRGRDRDRDKDRDPSPEAPKP